MPPVCFTRPKGQGYQNAGTGGFAKTVYKIIIFTTILKENTMKTMLLVIKYYNIDSKSSG
jgi:hypothetical protein